MNASIPPGAEHRGEINRSRRGFLTRLFNEPGQNTPGSGLEAQPDLRKHTDAVLWAATSGDSGELFIAGDDGMMFRHADDAWMRETMPSKLPVHALCASGDRLYSVGWLGMICERRNGQWQPVMGGESDTSRDNLPLFDIEADACGDLWAVGDQGRITQFDGQSWREHNSGTTANLRCVLPLADGRVLVAGSGGTALVFEAGHWRSMQTHSGCPIVSMAQLGDDSVIAVGGEYDVSDSEFRGRIFLFKDDQWQLVESELPLPRLRRVRSTGSGLVICGDDGTAFRWTEHGAKRIASRLRYDLHDLVYTQDGQLLICGDGGTLLRETSNTEQLENESEHSPSRWQQISQGETNRTLRTLWHIENDLLIAAGDGGTVLHIQGDSLQLKTTPQQLRIHSVWGSSARNIYAACDSATILHFDGEEWAVAHRGNVDTALLAITGFGPHDIFAVGDNGYALRYDGLMWRPLETAVKQELYALWGQDSQHLLAIGGGGLVLRWNGERWTSFSAGTDQDLYGVSGSGLDKLFIAGLAGTVIRFENNAWHRDFSGVRSDLHALCHDQDTFWAVGSNGTVLRNTDGIWETEQSGCDDTLQAVTPAATGVYAVGSGGLVLRRH